MKSKVRKTPSWRTAISLKKIMPALGKIGFTTLGILLALWVNNCNDDHKKRNTERETLLEIRAGLEQDRADVAETIRGYQFRVHNIETIFDYLRRDSPPADSLAACISNLTGYSFLLANTAAYETLKSRGLETVSNDSLRLGISTLYDVDYEAIQTSEKNLSELYYSLLLPHLVHHQTLGADKLTAAEMAEIKADRPFKQILWQVKFINQETLARYFEANKSLETLLSEIERELKSRRF
jgi:hypothetical protein